MAVIEMRRGAEEAFLADLALVGARRQVGMRLARGLALDLGKLDVALHGPPRAAGAQFSFNMKPIGREVAGQCLPLSGLFEDRDHAHAARGAHRDQPALGGGDSASCFASDATMRVPVAANG